MNAPARKYRPYMSLEQIEGVVSIIQNSMTQPDYMLELLKELKVLVFKIQNDAVSPALTLNPKHLQKLPDWKHTIDTKDW